MKPAREEYIESRKICEKNNNRVVVFSSFPLFQFYNLRSDTLVCLQHPWRNTIRAAVDLEALGIGGKHYLFQVNPLPFLNLTACRGAPVNRVLQELWLFRFLYGDVELFRSWSLIPVSCGSIYVLLEILVKSFAHNHFLMMCLPNNLRLLALVKLSAAIQAACLAEYLAIRLHTLGYDIPYKCEPVAENLCQISQ